MTRASGCALRASRMTLGSTRLWIGQNPGQFFTGAMQAGERKEFRSKVPIMVRLTDAERIKIERNGKALDTKGAKGLQLFRIVSK